MRIYTSALIAFATRRFDVLLFGLLAAIFNIAGLFPFDEWVAASLKAIGAIFAFMAGMAAWKSWKHTNVTSAQIADVVADEKLLTQLGATKLSDQRGICVELDKLFNTNADVIASLELLTTRALRQRAAELNCIDYIGTQFADFPGNKRNRNDRIADANLACFFIGSTSGNGHKSFLTSVIPMTDDQWDRYLSKGIADNQFSADLVASYEDAPETAHIFLVAADCSEPNFDKRVSARAILVSTILQAAVHCRDLNAGISCVWSAGDENMDPLWRALNFAQTGVRNADGLHFYEGLVCFGGSTEKVASWLENIRAQRSPFI